MTVFRAVQLSLTVENPKSIITAKTVIPQKHYNQYENTIKKIFEKNQFEKEKIVLNCYRIVICYSKNEMISIKIGRMLGYAIAKEWKLNNIRNLNLTGIKDLSGLA